MIWYSVCDVFGSRRNRVFFFSCLTHWLRSVVLFVGEHAAESFRGSRVCFKLRDVCAGSVLLEVGWHCVVATHMPKRVLRCVSLSVPSYSTGGNGRIRRFVFYSCSFSCLKVLFQDRAVVLSGTLPFAFFGVFHMVMYCVFVCILGDILVPLLQQVDDHFACLMDVVFRRIFLYGALIFS